MNRIKRFFREHAIAIVGTILIIALGYGMFAFVRSMGNFTTERDAYDSFVNSMTDKFGAIALIGDYETANRSPDAEGNIAVPEQGEYPDIRDTIFKGTPAPVSAETYINEANGKCGAVFTYVTDAGTFLVYYEKGIIYDSDINTGDTASSENSVYFGEDICIKKK